MRLQRSVTEMRRSSATRPNPSTSGSGAADDVATTDALPPVDVFQVSGLFDEVMVDAVTDAVHRAEDNGSQALILQLNTGGAVVSDADMASLVETVRGADVAIGIWVGPSKSARAYGTPAQLFGVADVTAMVAGTAPWSRTICSTSVANSTFCGKGRPWLMMVLSSATTGRPSRRASATSGCR